MDGRELFSCYAFPPNELGYCGPTDTSRDELASHAGEFDGAWPYLQALANVAEVPDPLDDAVVRSYWVGGPLLDKTDPDELLTRLRSAFTGQTTGLLSELTSGKVLAHHSFHVFVVYPWVLFLDRDPTTPLRVMQNCRIRWGTVESVEGDFVALRSSPLTFEQRVLGLGAAVVEHARWRKGDAATTAAPRPGDIVTAHWDWVCDVITDTECAALAEATRRTVDLVNDSMSARFVPPVPG
ncbi:MAG TPA: DUF6390 family protein [Mycobacterium sp.]|nr:DUF6390 family protein [Mycobacterium sp.]